ncbi:ABC transporter permease subunit [Frigoribacterium sp. UYMn621]|jgi:ABC-type transport system involved in multi-copper enzyme maturation permease subunit|uniref:ABC transporter permease n=1 Tax=Frigoribacterium sp. UYMn621 TaxID=3156343 RepID=UPI00339444E9
MTNLFTISSKELLDLRRDPLLAILVGFLSFAVVISVVIGAADFKVQLDAYNLYVQQLVSAGSAVVPAAPQLFPMQLLRGGIEYIEILGALFAVVLGYGTIAKEKYRGTLDLILTRPLGRFSLVGGKLLGLAVLWLAVVAFLTVVSTMAIATVGGASLSSHDLIRIVIASAAAWIYLVFWSALSVGLTVLARQLSTGLIVGLVIWLVVVLIMPQIGDTMDPDNQVPGGLFASLQIKKADELTVMSHFASFDAVRNGIEVASIEKHFERLSFGFLGIKTQYNQQPLSFIWGDLFPYAITLAAATFASVLFAMVATTRRTLQRK